MDNHHSSALIIPIVNCIHKSSVLCDISVRNTNPVSNVRIQVVAITNALGVVDTSTEITSRSSVVESAQVVGHPEPEITTTEQEDSSGSEHLAVTHAPSALFSEEEFTLLGRYYSIHGQFRFVHTFLCAT
jgi:hypothetical protein